jgi:hypothetical protein
VCHLHQFLLFACFQSTLLIAAILPLLSFSLCDLLLCFLFLLLHIQACLAASALNLFRRFRTVHE